MARKQSSLPKISEKEFSAQIMALARMRNWRRAHFRPARVRCQKCKGSGEAGFGTAVWKCSGCHGTGDCWETPIDGDAKGFLDLVLVRDRVIWAEIKVPPNVVTPDQQSWVDALLGAGQEVYVWRPEDWKEIEEALA